jgi:hypothetical protein
LAETGGHQQHDGGGQRPHAGFGDGLRDREDRPSWEPAGNEVAASVTTIVVKPGVSMHSAKTDLARPEATAGVHSFQRSSRLGRR